MLIGINRIKIKSDNQEIRVDLVMELDGELTDDMYAKLVASIMAIELSKIKRQDPDLFSMEEDLAVHIATLLLENFEENNLVAEVFKITLDDDSEFYHEEGSSFLQKREGERMAYIPLNLKEWDLSD
jgi:hypothetical protein